MILATDTARTAEGDPAPSPAPHDPPIAAGSVDRFPGPHEGDAGASVALGADVLALGASGLARRLGIPAVPVELVAPVWFLDSLPGLRPLLERTFGPGRTAAGVAVANATASGLAQGFFGLLVDLAFRTGEVAEVRARDAAWHRRVHALAATGRPTFPAPAAAPRPTRLPPGPIERAALSGSLAGVGGGVTALALAEPRLAARFLLLGLPRAARLGREGFAAQLGRALSARGVIARDRSVLRLLDRVDTVVLDTRVLLNGRWDLADVQVVEEVEDAREAGERFRAQAYALLDPRDVHHMRRRDEWSLCPVDHLDEPAREVTEQARRMTGEDRHVLGLCREDRLVALLAVTPSVDPQATDLIEEARRAGQRVLLSANPPASVSLPADGVLGGGEDLTEAIRGLQREGHVVALVSADSAALGSADCGIGIVREGGPVPWGAHLLGGGSLDDAAAVLQATGTAREVSRRSALLSVIGSAGGIAVATADPTPMAGSRAFTVVNSAALASIGAGAWAGLSATDRPRRFAADPTPWHAMPADAVLRLLDTGTAGLHPADAQRRRVPVTRDGGGGGMLRILLDELATPLTPVLAAGAGLSALLGSVLDAGLVTGVLVVNAVAGALQRRQTDRAVSRLEHTTSIPVRVLRAGQPAPVPADDLVPGDVLLVQAGDPVPADCRLLDATALEMDESTLTGESLPVAKAVAPSAAVAVAERTSMLYEGTTVAAGEAVAVVVATGAATEAGRSAAGAGRGVARDGVEGRLAALTNQAVPVSLAGGAAAAAAALLHGRPLRHVLGTGVSLTVAAVPEGLPILATIAQLSAARRLSERGALVREPRTIEALGRVDVVCVDKTGTLTEGRMRLRRVSDGAEEERAGTLTGARREVVAAALRATPVPQPGQPLPHATDRAVVEGARSAGVTRDEGGSRGWELQADLPFEPARGFHATAGRDAGGDLLSVKGAPEVILPRCTAERRGGDRRPIDDERRSALEAQVEAWARHGTRVLAVAERRMATPGSLEAEDVGELELHGLLGLSDPVRPAAREAVDDLRRAGVAVAMITGDHPSTAEAVGAELGVVNGGRVVTGAELDDLDDARLSEILPAVTVYARVTPAHKVRIVAALQRAGRVVAMTGDGANDAAAIRLADVGVALGGDRSTPAARHAADVIVTDDRVETLIDAVVEGRAMWASVRDALAILLGGNLGEIGYTVFTSAFSRGAPITARQLLLVNLLTDMAPATVIALRPPRDTSPETLLTEGPESSLGSALTREVQLRATATAAGASGAWMAARVTGRAARARTVGLVALVGTQLGQTLVSGWRSPLVAGTALLSSAVLAGIVQTPGLSHFFGCTPLGPAGWAIAGSAASMATGASVVLPHLDGLIGTQDGQDPSQRDRKEEPEMTQATSNEQQQEEQRTRAELDEARQELSQSQEYAARSGEQVGEAGAQAQQAGVHAGRATRSALAEVAFATVGVGGYLADGVKLVGTSLGRGFVQAATRGRVALGSVPPHLRDAARSAQEAAEQAAEGTAEVVEEVADTVEDAAEDVQERLQSAREDRTEGRAQGAPGPSGEPAADLQSHARESEQTPPGSTGTGDAPSGEGEQREQGTTTGTPTPGSAVSGNQAGTQTGNPRNSAPDYERMTVDGLRARARAAGVERPWKMNKNELIRALRQASSS